MFTADALTDIVSNMIGVIVLLNLTAVLFQGSRPRAVELPELSSQIGKAPFVFLLHGQHLLPIDPAHVGLDLMEYANHHVLAADNRVPVLGGRLDAWFDRDGRVFVAPRNTDAWEAIREQAFAHIDPDRGFAFVFVDEAPGQASFAGLAAVSAALRTRGVDMHWLPFDKMHPAFLCAQDGDDGCNYQSELAAPGPEATAL